MRWLGGTSVSMDISVSQLGELVLAREAWRAAVRGVAEWAPELNGGVSQAAGTSADPPQARLAEGGPAGPRAQGATSGRGRAVSVF